MVKEVLSSHRHYGICSFQTLLQLLWQGRSILLVVNTNLMMLHTRKTNKQTLTNYRMLGTYTNRERPTHIGLPAAVVTLVWMYYDPLGVCR